MKSVKLGTRGLVVSRMGLGCMGMSEFYGPADDGESIRTLHRALDLGINFFDTADMYGVGRNEALIARAIKGKRNSVIVATKFGNVRGPNGEFLGVKGTPDYVRQCCDSSLKRLGIDSIDLYYQHRVDPNVPIEDTVGAMAELVRAGKVRYLGLSEAAVATVRRAHATHPISALQTEYSLWSRDPEPEIIPCCRELGIGFVPYSPLGRGFLTGTLAKVETLAEGDWRRNLPRLQTGNVERNLRIVDAISAIADRHKAKPGQIALAWVLAQGEDIVPIPGTRRIAYLEENAAAAGIVLAPAELAELDRAAPRGAAAGTRYPAAAMAMLDR